MYVKITHNQGLTNMYIALLQYKWYCNTSDLASKCCWIHSSTICHEFYKTQNPQTEIQSWQQWPLVDCNLPKFLICFNWAQLNTCCSHHYSNNNSWLYIYSNCLRCNTKNFTPCTYIFMYVKYATYGCIR